jgi:hypothetical protein
MFGTSWWFLVQAARSSYQELQLRDLLRGVEAEDVMAGELVRIPPQLSLRDAVDDYFIWSCSATRSWWRRTPGWTACSTSSRTAAARCPLARSGVDAATSAVAEDCPRRCRGSALCSLGLVGPSS